jgi:hypothetical protein
MSPGRRRYTAERHITTLRKHRTLDLSLLSPLTIKAADSLRTASPKRTRLILLVGNPYLSDSLEGQHRISQN